MSMNAPITVNMDAYLGLNRYSVDEGHPHIELVEEPSRERFLELVRACPAGLYKLNDHGEQQFDYAGCLECGTCRILARDTIVKTWEYPSSSMGIEYRYG